MKFGNVGVVVIGRNEGERLALCLEALASVPVPMLYVDSASEDGSIALAHRWIELVITLPVAIPRSAAAARNLGFDQLTSLFPDVEYVQFIDGDCVMEEGWLEQGLSALAAAPEAAIVCGRRREAQPYPSIFHALIDVEWDVPIGWLESCGGDFLVRAEVFKRVGGFRTDLIAGEEPDLCNRLRRHGWRVLRVDSEMTVHSLGSFGWADWFKRGQRGGYAYTDAVLRDGLARRFEARRLASVWFWAFGLPLLNSVTIRRAPSRAAMPLIPFVGLLLTQIGRAGGRLRSRGYDRKICAIYALQLYAVKFPQLFGSVQAIKNHMLKRRATLIEYK